MDALDSESILSIAENGQILHPVDRALVILASAAPHLSRHELALLPIGRRDAYLLALRKATFGNRMELRTRCPACGEAAEFEVLCNSFEVPGENENSIAPTLSAVVGEHEVRLRLPNSYDLAAIAPSGDAGDAGRILFSRSLLEVREGERILDVASLPASFQQKVSRILQEADPLAEVIFDVKCPSCPNVWQSTLDIGDVLWREIVARAKRLLMEVATLARAYGWREADILAMSPKRRESYLQLVNP